MILMSFEKVLIACFFPNPFIELKMCWQFPNNIAYCQLQQMGKIDVLVQERCNSIADALELHLSWTKPSI